MCLAVPMKLIKKEGDKGIVLSMGVEREVSLALLPEAEIGDWVIVHAGFAIERMDEEEARESLKLLEEMWSS
ncbi:MAG: HypC/HybG/HupF family hydrogenase formation chaperone [Candidatus Aminicenantes bacterium]|nr:HypC/HybG/HupF family hydrogenase formation chaperone [Candidatus Aminicenantes bacterium]